MHTRVIVLIVFWAIALAPITLCLGDNQDQPSTSALTKSRTTVFISDTHFGLGRDSAGWEPTEDFRWPHALKGFLDYLPKAYPDPVDLVVLGDSLELWQPPASLPCKGHGADLGCTIEEMRNFVAIVVRQHTAELNELKKFSQESDNKLYIVPGNHDSALLEPSVWAPVAEALGASSGRVVFVNDGIWASNDGTLVAEHGHQIGADLNRFGKWPKVQDCVDGVCFMIRPWGEQFVQQLFNDTEHEYPVIDNISPESAGIKLRIADRGIPSSAVDTAKFIAFNLFETSLMQKGQVLGDKDNAHTTEPKWDLQRGREMGYKLFLGALEDDDPLATKISEKSQYGERLQAELSSLARDEVRFPNENVLQLCVLVEMRQRDFSCLHKTKGLLKSKLLDSKSDIMVAHLRGRADKYRNLQFFVYAHTHEFEVARKINLSATKPVTVANTGAFQRVVDEETFDGIRTNKGISKSNALKAIGVEDLPPCYTFVVFSNGQLVTWRWHQAEDSDGTAVLPTDPGICKSGSMAGE